MRPPACTLVLAAALAASAAAPRQAEAQVPRSFDLERLRLDPSAQGSLVVGNGEVGPRGTARLSLSGMVEDRPLVYRDDLTLRGRGLSASGTALGDVVKSRFTMVLGVSVVAWDDVELFLRVPWVASQKADDITAYGLEKAASHGAGAPSLGARAGLLHQGAGAPLSLAAALELVPGSGSAPAVAGGESMAISPRVEVGHRYRRILVGAELHAVLRGAGEKLGPETLGNELGGGLVVARAAGRLRYELSLRGASVGMGGKNTLHAELLAGARARLRRLEVFALAGPGFGDAPGTPGWRALVGLAYDCGRGSPPQP